MDTEFDFVVLGGGSAGYAAARTAIELGLKTAVVDGSAELGGLCILRGCMPSKALIETANRSITIRRAAEFGIKAAPAEIDPPAILSRKRALIKDFADYRAGQLEDGRFTLFRGRGQYVDSETIHVTNLDGSEATITAKTSVIATGSVISVPNVPGLADSGYFTSDDVLDSEQIPESVIVLGGGAIALEMAHYYEGLGRKVTVIQRNEQLLTGMDRDLADALKGALEHRMDVFCGTKLLSVETSDAGKSVTFEQDGETKSVTAEQILAALGRRPASDGLAVENASVETDRGRVATQPSQQTTTPNIFAAGDVCGPHEIVHIAIEQGEAAARNAAKHLKGESDFETMDYRLKLYGIFTEPQVAAVGMSELEAKGAGRSVNVETYPFDDHGKSMVRGETEGFVKLIADAETGEIVGGSAVGPEVTELIHEIVVAMHFRSTAAQLAKIPHYHPTLSEIWTYPAEELAEASAAEP